MLITKPDAHGGGERGPFSECSKARVAGALGAEMTGLTFPGTGSEKPFHRFARQADDWFSIAEPWQAPVVDTPGMRGFYCYRSCEAVGIDACREVAREILGPKELEVWSQLQTPEQRRRQWLLGRLCAKKAVGQIVKPGETENGCLSELEILADEHGCPVAGGTVIGRLDGWLSISIAHSQDTVAAIAGTRDRFFGVGIDLEPVARDYRVLERAALRHEERLLLRERIREAQPEWVVRLWCAKEALAKAIGLGMIGGPLSFMVKDLETSSGKVILTLEGKPVERRRELRGRLFPVFTGRDKEIVYATAILD